MTVRIHQGDCREVLKAELADASVDSVVTDPPYELTNTGGGPSGRGTGSPHSRARAGAARGGFMGMKWDGTGVAFDPETWRQALRVLKPGGYLLAFGGTRTYHRMVCAMEDAGFEIRDQMAWVYGSGFPKSHNGPWGGTALKPAWEPIVVARKPLAGTVEANWREHGTGALNIDGCRIDAEPMPPNTGKGAMLRRTVDEVREARPPAQPHDLGRWPANLIHDGSDEVLQAFPQASGQRADLSAAEPSAKVSNVYAGGPMPREGEASAQRRYGAGGNDGFAVQPGARRIDTGSAARFFYCAKASKADRNEGGADNTHPTVKPTELMRYLVRLVTPPGGTVLDMFTGSGSTLKAAELEGLDAVGVELLAHHIEIARRRIAADAPLFQEVA